MNRTMGIGLALYGLYLGYYGATTHDDVSIMLWVKSLLATGGGLGVAGYSYLDKIKELIAKFQSGEKLTLQDLTNNKLSLETSQNEEYLFYCKILFVLSEKIKDTPEGLQIGLRLNSILFSKYHSTPAPVDPTVPVEEVKK
jgi:hypothetical protein